MFITIIGKIAIISLIRINLLFFRKEKQCVFCEVELSIDVRVEALKC
jgi:hypothetical protein